jgi:hydrogenase maturation protease
VTVVIGIGNPDRGDDAAGLAVARRLAARRPAGVTVVEAGGGACGLLDAWRGGDAVVVVDATSGAGRPGSVHRYEVGRRPLPSAFRHASTHSLGLAAAVELARALGELPRRLVVVGLEGRDFEPGAPLSAEVEQALEAAVEVVTREIDGADRRASR